MQRCGGCRRHLAAAEVRCPFCSARVGLVPAGPIAAFALALVGMSSACSDRSVAEAGAADESSTGTSSDPTTSMSASTSSASSTLSGTAEATSGPFETSSVDTGNDVDTAPSSVGFIYGDPADVGGGIIECDVFAQDCPDGSKCMPWANDGGQAWNATHCTPVAEDPHAPGEPCLVEGNGLSGFDDCELRAMCWDVDPDTDMGECVAQCDGTEAAPECPDGTACMIANDGVLTLCLRTCDPKAPTCDADELCSVLDDGAFCVPGGAGDTD